MNLNDRDMDINERHKARMQRRKTVVDQKMGEAQRDAGLVIVATGAGKGKSSSGFGMVARALGHGKKVGVVQFIKGAIPTGEERFFRRFPDELEFHIAGEGYTWETQDRERDMRRAEAGWVHARRMLADPGIGLVLLDELNIVLRYRYLDVQKVLADLRARPAMRIVIRAWRSPKSSGEHRHGNNLVKHQQISVHKGGMVNTTLVSETVVLRHCSRPRALEGCAGKSAQRQNRSGRSAAGIARLANRSHRRPNRRRSRGRRSCCSRATTARWPRVSVPSRRKSPGKWCTTFSPAARRSMCSAARRASRCR